MTLWWYVPGVSSRSRRSSRFEGFASSSIWNTVMIPNTLPSTAKLPAASATDDGRVEDRPPTELACAARSRCSSRLKAMTTATLSGGNDEEDADERVEPLGAGDRQQRRQPADEDVDGELERVAVHDAGEDRQRNGHHRAGGAGQEDPESSTVAGGRHDEREQRAVGRDPQRNRGHHEREEEEQDRSIAVPDLRLEAPQVADQQRGDQQERDQACPTTVPSSTQRPGQAERVEHLELLDRDRVALVDDPLAGRTVTSTAGTSARAWSICCGRELLVGDLGRRHECGGQVAGQLALRARRGRW